MKTLNYLIILLLLWSASSLAAQPQPLYQFHVPQQKQRFDALITNFRCLVCQNENLAQSTAKLAGQFRQEIASMIKAGKTDQQIQTYFVKRYGNFILYEPPFVDTTIVLWLAPTIFLLIGLVIFVGFIYSRRKSKG